MFAKQRFFIENHPDLAAFWDFQEPAGYRYCMDAAIGKTPVPLDTWQCVAFTYDGLYAKAYLNGKLDERGDRNPYLYEGGIFDGGEDGAEFTVGGVSRSGEMGNWFTGVIGGLAVFRTALSDAEMKQLHV